jgi:hypothetical protein
MIISVSRRTDIPRFYSDWFMKRIRAGYVLVANPYNPLQIARVSLKVKDVTAFVFWTRFPAPLFPGLQELDDLGFPYYFQVTLNNYPAPYETNAEPLPHVLHAFAQLVNKIGASRIVWRYDPIFFTQEMTLDFHLKNFQFLCNALQGCTQRAVISLLDEYRKTVRHLDALQRGYAGDPLQHRDLLPFLGELAGIARHAGMAMETCAESTDFSAIGIHPGRCIDERLLNTVFGLNLAYRKDPSQRTSCGCMISKDIGVNNTCPGGCVYCYATANHIAALQKFKQHNPEATALIPIAGDEK